MEQVIATSDQELTSRKVKFLLDTPQQDDGQWDMVVSLFEKYGVVPKSVYTESISSICGNLEAFQEVVGYSHRDYSKCKGSFIQQRGGKHL